MLVYFYAKTSMTANPHRDVYINTGLDASFNFSLCVVC